MKKVYISADIEGVCGIADWKETDLGEAQGAYFRAEMTREVAAACEGANAAGAELILVKDAHGSGRNLDPSKLPENVRIMRAWTRDPLVMMAGVDGGFDAAMYLGYHSAGGTDGNPLAHTMDTNNVLLLVNGQIASEFLINAYTAAAHGVPSVLVSGDRQLCEDAGRLVPGIAAVPVSEGLGNASISIHPALAERRIREAAREALAAAPAPEAPRLPGRFEIDILFRHHHLAHRGSFYPGARKKGPLELVFETDSWIEAIRFMFFVL